MNLLYNVNELDICIILFGARTCLFSCARIRFSNDGSKVVFQSEKNKKRMETSKMKKKLFSVFLAIVMVVTALPMVAFAEDEQYPVVIDSGYSSSQIFLFDDEGNIVKRVWGLDMGGILTTAAKDIPDLTLAGLELYANKNPEKLRKQLVSAMSEIIELMKRNDDGTPKYNTGTWPTTPEESNMKYIYDNMDKIEYLKGTIHEKRYTPILCEKIGSENVFQFSTDWRQEIIFCARDLGKYIKSVLDFTGAKKVNIFSESHGGQTTGTYIALCSLVEMGGEKAATLASLLGLSLDELKTYFNLDYVNNAVLNSPAIGGVQLAYDLISGNSHFDTTRIIEFVEYGNNPFQEVIGGDEYVWESEYEWLLAFAKLDKTNNFLNTVIQDEEILSIVLSLGSMWDFIDVEHYDEIKETKLNTAEKKASYAPMIENTDFSHYNVMNNLNEYLTYARSRGVNVNIVCGTDITTATGSTVNGDCLVAAKTASGAKVTDYGYRFSNGYTTDYTDSAVTCKDSSHNHVSPSMNLDGAYGYLPENTWYIEGQFHAQYAYDDYALPLTDELLLGNLTSVYDNPAYPQFETTYNAKCGVHASFDKSAYGRVTSDDTALVIKNVSRKSGIELISVKVEGADVSLSNVKNKKLEMGESVSIPLKSAINEKGMTNFTVTIYYLEKNAAFAMDGRKFNFTVLNDDLADYDASNPFTEVKMTPIYMTPDDVKEELSQFDWFTQLRALILVVVRVFRTIGVFFKNLMK